MVGSNTFVQTKAETLPYYDLFYRNGQTSIINRQRQGPMWKLNPKTQTLNHNTVHFGFNKMTTDGRLPPEVLRKVRDLGLLPEGTKIKRL